MHLYRAIELLASDLLGGSTRPWQVRAVRDDDVMVIVVVKVYTAQQVEQYQPIAKEVYGYGLAGSFGLKAPAFGLIDLGEDFVATLGQADRLRLKDTPSGWKFAVEWVENASLVDMAHLSRSVFNEYEVPLVYAYDHVVWNGDRDHHKPNLLVNEHELILIDHEMCFPHENHLHLDQWQQEKRWGYPYQRHLFYPMLKAKKKETQQEMFDEFEEYLRKFNLSTVDNLANFLADHDVKSPDVDLIRKQLRILKAESSLFRKWLIQSLA